MATWIALGISVLAYVIAIAVTWGIVKAEIDAMKIDIINLQSNSQSPSERRALAQVLENKLTAHNQLDDLRFGNIEHKLDEILTLIRDERRREGD
jgi:hypothetical protein